MTPEQLLEATAKAIFRTCAYTTCDFEQADEDIQESYRVHARAALAVAIEQCAKVIEGWDTYDVWLSDGASAIRALFPARKDRNA